MYQLRGALAVAVVIGLTVPQTARAQAYPERPIKMIVPTPPGGPIDTMARVVANGLGPVIGQSIVVDNRGGAG